MDFTAIDFETASHRRDSACQLAAVKVRDREIVDSVCWLIRPEPFHFSPSNIRIHGITPAQVSERPDFGQLWNEMSPWLVDECLIAHNASFDIGVLRACLQAHAIHTKDFHFNCTRAIARKTWPGRRGYGLKPLSDWLGVRFKHHDALEDSIACAKVLLAAAIDRSAESIEDLETKLGLSRGTAGDWGYRGPSARRSKKRSGVSARGGRLTSPTTPIDQVPARQPDRHVEMQRLLVRAQFIQPLAGQRVGFWGRFVRFSRDEVERIAASFGGTCEPDVTSQTNIIVIGDSAETEAGQFLESSASVVTETEFLNLVVATGP